MHKAIPTSARGCVRTQAKLLHFGHMDCICAIMFWAHCKVCSNYHSSCMLATSAVHQGSPCMVCLQQGLTCSRHPALRDMELAELKQVSQLIYVTTYCLLKHSPCLIPWVIDPVIQRQQDRGQRRQKLCRQHSTLRQQEMLQCRSCSVQMASVTQSIICV